MLMQALKAWKNLILFLEPCEEQGELLRYQKHFHRPRTARYQAQDIGTYNPGVLCRVFAVLGRQTTAVIFGLLSQAQIWRPFLSPKSYFKKG